MIKYTVLALALILTAGCSGDEPPPAEPTPAPTATPAPTPTPPPWVEVAVTVKSGQVITKLLQAEGLEYGEALGLVQAAAPIHDLARIRAGEVLTVRRDPAGGPLMGLVYPLDRFGEQKLVVSRTEEGSYEAERVSLATQIEPVVVEGVVESSFWGACESAGLTSDTIMDLAGIFDWEIDFNTQLRKGDSFRMVVESVQDESTGEHLRHGRILAARFVNTGTPFEGYRYEDSDGKVGYFNAEGMSTRKMFLKSPLKFSRISSGFGKRFHPILKKWRNHNGIDYAASTGTPVRAIGRGTVTWASRKGSYGKHVRLKHTRVYGSSYSHLSRIAVKKGAVVDQGQIVGYVGATGRVTGPHLHFEFYINGKYVDFRRQTFKRSEPISDKERPAFDQERARWSPLLGEWSPPEDGP